jgi:hypothetical protein
MPRPATRRGIFIGNPALILNATQLRHDDKRTFRRRYVGIRKKCGIAGQMPLGGMTKL